MGGKNGLTDVWKVNMTAFYPMTSFHTEVAKVSTTVVICWTAWRVKSSRLSKKTMV